MGRLVGGWPSCFGSKYLHSPSSRRAERRGLDVLGYVKSNPPGRRRHRTPLVETLPEQGFHSDQSVT